MASKPAHVKLFDIIKIKDPDKQGDYLLIEASSFNAEIHTLFDAEDVEVKTRKPRGS